MQDIEVFNLLEENKTALKNLILEEIYLPNLKPSLLKPVTEAINGADICATEYIDQLQSDIVKGYHLFLDLAEEEEKEILEKALLSITSVNEEINDNSTNCNSTNFENDLLLQRIAKRVLAKGDYENASCMFRFIIQMHIAFVPAWVGWFLSESLQKHDEIVEQILSLGLSLFPADYFLCTYSAKYYGERGQRQKALSLLQNGLAILEESHVNDEEILEKFENLIKHYGV